MLRFFVAPLVVLLALQADTWALVRSAPLILRLDLKPRSVRQFLEKLQAIPSENIIVPHASSSKIWHVFSGLPHARVEKGGGRHFIHYTSPAVAQGLAKAGVSFEVSETPYIRGSVEFSNPVIQYLDLTGIFLVDRPLTSKELRRIGAKSTEAQVVIQVPHEVPLLRIDSAHEGFDFFVVPLEPGRKVKLLLSNHQCVKKIISFSPH